MGIITQGCQIKNMFINSHFTFGNKSLQKPEEKYTVCFNKRESKNTIIYSPI